MCVGAGTGDSRPLAGWTGTNADEILAGRSDRQVNRAGEPSLRSPDLVAVNFSSEYGRRSGKRFGWQQQIFRPVVCVGALDRSVSRRRV